MFPAFNNRIQMGSGMSSADRYREFAAECLRVAQRASNPDDKALLVEMAEVWRRMAERACKAAGVGVGKAADLGSESKSE